MRKRHCGFFTVLAAGLLTLAACPSLGRHSIDYGEYIALEGIPMTSEYTAENMHVARSENSLVISAGSVKVDYNLVNGTADLYRAGSNSPFLAGFFAEAYIGETRISSADLSRPEGSVFLEEIHDDFGEGVKISVRSVSESLIMWQNFYAYRTREYMFFEIIAESPVVTRSNHLAPIVAGTESAAATQEVLFFDVPENTQDAQRPDLRFLAVPYSNDAFRRYNSAALNAATESCEVTAIFDNTSRRGFITGSVTHDTWKTGIRANTNMRTGEVNYFRVFGGLSSRALTSDTQPHGSIEGYYLHSPKIFTGFYDDWRDGMEEYGRAVAVIAPPLPWDGGPPWGWNSWYAMGIKLEAELFFAASDFFKNNLSDFNNGKSPVYINFDAFWDNFSEQRRREAADHAKRNGQIPGFYDTPFAFWGTVEQSMLWTVRETQGRYQWFDLLLKDARGNPVPGLAQGYAMDPTHPGTRMFIESRLRNARDWGFQYFKLDFMDHGMQEGVFHDRRIKTGRQAYNYGMQIILDVLGDDITNQEVFLNLAISPIFPGNFTHSRFICCDTFGELESTDYLLNSVTYGWWQNGTVHTFIEPSHIVLYTSFMRDEQNQGPLPFAVVQTRYIASAISGAVMLVSEDYRLPEARERAMQIMTNPEINALAAEGRTFRPVEGNTGDRSNDTFVRRDDDGFLLAVFNFGAEREKIMNISLERIGLETGRTYRVRNLVARQDETSVSGSMTIHLPPAGSAVYRLY